VTDHGRPCAMSIRAEVSGAYQYFPDDISIDKCQPQMHYGESPGPRGTLRVGEGQQSGRPL